MISHEQLKPSRILSAKVDLPLPLPPHIPTIIICILRFINSVSRIFFRRSEAFGIQPSRTAWAKHPSDRNSRGSRNRIVAARPAFEPARAWVTRPPLIFSPKALNTSTGFPSSGSGFSSWRAVISASSAPFAPSASRIARISQQLRQPPQPMHFS